MKPHSLRKCRFLGSYYSRQLCMYFHIRKYQIILVHFSMYGVSLLSEICLCAHILLWPCMMCWSGKYNLPHSGMCIAISKIVILCTVDTFQITPVRRCWWWWEVCHPVILETSSTPSMYVRERKIISKMAFPLPIQHTVVLLWTIAGVHHAIEYLRW